MFATLTPSLSEVESVKVFVPTRSWDNCTGKAIVWDENTVSRLTANGHGAD
jgi:hypothetical protein